MPIGNHHQVAVIVGVAVEDDVALPSANEHQIVSVIQRRRSLTEETSPGAGTDSARHIGESPGRPKVFQMRSGYTASASGGSAAVSATGAMAEGAGSRLMSSFSSFPGLKYGTFFGGTSTLSPVFGLRPFRGSRFRNRKLPKPRNSIFSPRCSASMMLLNTVSTMISECFLVRSETRETSSTSSALVMLPPVMCYISQPAAPTDSENDPRASRRRILRLPDTPPSRPETRPTSARE